MAPIGADTAFDRVQQAARLVVESRVTSVHLKALSKHDEAKVVDATDRPRQKHYVDFVNDPSLLLHMSSGNKSRLLSRLSDKRNQTTSPFDSPKLLSFAEKHVPQRDVEHETIVHSLAPSAEQFSDTQERLVPWTLDRICSVFSEKLASVTSCALDKQITMVFPDQGLVDCLMTFPIELEKAEQLMRAWFGMQQLQLVDEHLILEDKEGHLITVDAVKGIKYNGVGDTDHVAELGESILPYIHESRVWQAENLKGNMKTVGLRAGTEISRKLLK